MALMRRIWAVSLLVASLGWLSPAALGGNLGKLWEIDLKKVVRRDGGLADFPVLALRFSPDGRKLAVIADVYGGTYGSSEGRRSRLLVVDVERPEKAPLQFEIEWSVFESELGRHTPLNFGWTPSGEIIYAGGRVIHLADGTTCQIPNQSVFLGDTVAISARPEPPGSNSRTRLTYFDQNCGERDSWDVPEGWSVTDASGERALLSVLRESGTSAGIVSEQLVVDPLTRKVLQRWPVAGQGEFEFADSGKAVCSAGGVLTSDLAPARCRNVDTGAAIGESLRNGGEPIATAERTTRVVVSDYRRWKPG